MNRIPPDDSFTALLEDMRRHETNQEFTRGGIEPLFSAVPGSKILIVGQAPGIRAQTHGLPWGDASGERLMQWLGVTETEFRDPNNFAILPMDFYYPGKGKTGDLPPRKEAAELWHPRFLALLHDVRLTILSGRYAQDYYLKKTRKKNLTETVRAYRDYLPEFFPIVHPSPLNFRWHLKNPWFEEEVVPELQRCVAEILKK